MANIEQWRIQKRAHCCSVSGQVFKDGDTFYTALFLDETSASYIRRDFSTSAWKDHKEKPFSFWKNTYSKSQQTKKPELEPLESTEELLLRLQHENDTSTINTRYLLALILERKNLIRQTDIQRADTTALRVYEHKQSGAIFVIEEPKIDLHNLAELQHQVTALLATQSLTKETLNQLPEELH